MMPVNTLILLTGLLLLLGIASSKVSARLGLPVLVLFLVVGMLAGTEGIGGIAFENYPLAHGIGTVALAIILFAVEHGSRCDFGGFADDDRVHGWRRFVDRPPRLAVGRHLGRLAIPAFHGDRLVGQKAVCGSGDSDDDDGRSIGPPRRASERDRNAGIGRLLGSLGVSAFSRLEPDNRAAGRCGIGVDGPDDGRSVSVCPLAR